MVGTVRQKEKESKLALNTPTMDPAKFVYEIDPDVLNANVFDNIFNIDPQISIVLLIPSTFVLGTTDYGKNLLTPPIEGDKSILKVIQQQDVSGHCDIKRFKVTSSDEAFYLHEDEAGQTLSFDEIFLNGALLK